MSTTRRLDASQSSRRGASSASHLRPSVCLSAAHQTVMHLIKRLFHVRRIKESAAHVPLHSNHQHAASELQTMLGRCVFKADGADWSHKDKCTGQTRAEVWLVTLGQTHIHTHTHSQQMALCCGGLKSRQRKWFRKSFSYFRQHNWTPNWETCTVFIYWKTK